ncbi:hypothetical protein EZV62_019515 [Acer yangbiense]|uniref:RING-type E3 ubiquitin transferase n=1 Tax=Acer yangbiense TaxID=1000413 RepID=A0A5C7HBN3_9ROSI|nr:hypothetical protein EZV62_019515 [Acer yangbiense]
MNLTSEGQENGFLGQVAENFKVLHSCVLNFLLDPVDPNYNPLRDLLKLARRVLLSVPMHGSLIVMLVFLPVKLSMRMAPSFFPLDISVSDPFTEIPSDILLFQICIPFAIELFKLRTSIKSLLRYWFTAVGWALGLTDFLLPRPDENGSQENGNGDAGQQDRLHVLQLGVLYGSVVAVLEADLNRVLASENSNVSEDYNGDEQSGSEYGIVLRIVLLPVITWIILFVINSAMIVVPISFGRALVPLLPITHGIKCNDLYAFIIGSYVIWTAVPRAGYSIEHIRTKRAAVFPIIMKLLTALCVPYVLARGVFPVLGVPISSKFGSR